MRQLVAALMLAMLSSVAHAQQFEPYTINAQEHQALLSYLGDLPAKYANPLINQLTQFEQAAQQKKAAELAKTKPKDEPKK